MKHILFLVTSLVFVAVPALAQQQSPLARLQAQVDALQAQINALTSCSDASLVGTYIFKELSARGQGILDIRATRGTLVADGQGTANFSAVDTDLEIELVVPINERPFIRINRSTNPYSFAVTYAVNADCTGTLTAGDGSGSLPFVLLPGGAIAVETHDNSDNLNLGVFIRLRQ